MRSNSSDLGIKQKVNVHDTTNRQATITSTSRFNRKKGITKNIQVGQFHKITFLKNKFE